MKSHYLVHTCLMTFLISIIPSLAYSGCGGMTGDQLLTICEQGMKSADDPSEKLTPNEAYNSGTCLGYVNGFMYMEMAYSATLASQKYPNAIAEHVNKLALFCPTPGFQNREYVKVFMDYMSSHPEDKTKDACTALLDAFVRGYPCS